MVDLPLRGGVINDGQCVQLPLKSSGIPVPQFHSSPSSPSCTFPSHHRGARVGAVLVLVLASEKGTSNYLTGNKISSAVNAVRVVPKDSQLCPVPINNN